MDIPTNEEKQTDVPRKDSFSSHSPELDVPLLLPQDSDIIDASKSNNVLEKDQSLVAAEVETDDTFDQMSLLHSQSSVDWWETQERGDQIGFCNEPSQVGPRTSCHCQVSSSWHIRSFATAQLTCFWLLF